MIVNPDILFPVL